MRPYVRIRYKEVERNPEQQILWQLNINYSLNGWQFFQYIDIILFVLVFLSLICAAIRAYRFINMHYLTGSINRFQRQVLLALQIKNC